MSEGDEDAIYDEGYESSVHAWGPAYCNRPKCPYPEGSNKEQIWTQGLMAGISNNHDF